MTYFDMSVRAAFTSGLGIAIGGLIAASGVGRNEIVEKIGVGLMFLSAFATVACVITVIWTGS